jgi:DNA adenine methylase
MKYMGSKARHASELLPIILKDHTPDMWYIEPFVGGANMIDKVPADYKRIGCDINEYLIVLLDKLSKGWEPPVQVSEELYKTIKLNKDLFDKELVAYVGFGMSFGSKWWGGYSRNKRNYDYAQGLYNSTIKQRPLLEGIKFLFKSVFEIVEIKGKATIYCDPPYKDTTKYKDGGFDHSRFYNWCRYQKSQGHNIFISEYAMPDDFKCVWEKETINGFGIESNSKKGTEKLFTI